MNAAQSSALPEFRFIRVKSSDGRFAELEASWGKFAAEAGDPEYLTPALDHARGIAAEDPPDARYGIYILYDGDGEAHCMAHVNRAMLPGTSGHTLRIVWVMLSPKYDYQDVADEVAAALVSGLVHGAMGLCRSGDMASDHLKIHLQNRADRRLAAGLVQHLDQADNKTKVAVRGNWLHIDHVSA